MIVFPSIDLCILYQAEMKMYTEILKNIFTP